ncbi:hypothetical protein E3U43_014064 [Larimichthys crocea]|uniref:Uncharacterized protein n=1 Tax=Larimichthys crocea TaxID=215358 RepID=A0ACD3RCS3_LARCR|nr:hypothetical protein E3U43_014064 [Larimichthys crocea]
MRDQHTTMCKMMILERKCSDRAVRLCSALESQLHTGVSSSDVWDKTVSFFTVKKALIFHNGYNKSSREAMRLFPSPAEDVAPLCCQ